MKMSLLDDGTLSVTLEDNERINGYSTDGVFRIVYDPGNGRTDFPYNNLGGHHVFALPRYSWFTVHRYALLPEEYNGGPPWLFDHYRVDLTTGESVLYKITRLRARGEDWTTVYEHPTIRKDKVG